MVKRCKWNIELYVYSHIYYNWVNSTVTVQYTKYYNMVNPTVTVQYMKEKFIKQPKNGYQSAVTNNTESIKIENTKTIS